MDRALVCLLVAVSIPGIGWAVPRTSDAVAGTVVASEAEKVAVWDAAVAAGRAGGVKIAASTPAFDG